MVEQDDASAVATRIEELLDRFDSAEAPGARETAEDLVRTVMEFYGAGLGRIVELLRGDEAGVRLLRACAEDELVQGLLALHDLHPTSLHERVGEALDSVRPYLGSHSGDVELLDIDEQGVVRLRLKGNCDGCPSSAVTVKLAIEDAIRKAAPEISDIAVEGMGEQQSSAAGVATPTGPGGRTMLSVVTAESASDHGEQGAGATETASWVPVSRAGGLDDGAFTVLSVGNESVVICRADGELYAYRDRCTGCAGDLGQARLDGALLECPRCAERFDVRFAGTSEHQPGLHLDPWPLLADERGVRIALPEVVR